jgi:hypothetical protein
MGMRGVIVMRKRLKRFLGLMQRGLIQVMNVFASRHVAVLGDSHALIFGHAALRMRFPLTAFNVCSVQGATASGLDNPRSRTQAAQSFKAFLDGLDGPAAVVLQLGEVDTGFVIWWRAQKYGSSVDAMLAEALERYRSLISEVARRFPAIVVSVPLPTIQDGPGQGEVANLRSEVRVSQRERTELTLRFNAAIESACRELGVGYVNLDRLSLGGDGLVDKSLHHRNPGNHHYDNWAYARLLALPLRRALAGAHKSVD